MSVKEKILNSQRRILDRLIEWEESAAKLYGRYARRFPEQAEVWLGLAREEAEHAAALRAFHVLLDHGFLLEGIGGFDSSIVDQEIATARTALERADKPSLQLADAIATARAIETSVIETQFYDVVSCKAPEFEAIAEMIVGGSDRHLEKLRSLSA
ncbi:MAG TPA: hypothetical protein VIX81_12795 [Gammaproteobacteria bacterium]